MILAVPQATLVAFTRFPPAVSTPTHPPVTPRSEGKDRTTWRGSAWAILRQTARGQGLAAAGQLGGAQAGVRVSHDLGSGLAIAARVSGPLASGRGKETAVAIDWRPVAGLPLTLTLERRAGLDAGGRDAFAAGVFGGFDSVRVPGNARLDGYVQAGAVGLRRRDAYVDGAFRIERPIARQGGLEISAGAGLWGGAQPGVARLDTGPQIVAHVPVGPARLRIGAEWRARIAGNARPGSGPVLTIGADF